jgi:hypothetical protein
MTIEMVGKCTWQECEMLMTFWLGNQKVRDHTVDQGIDKRMFKRILKKWCVMALTDSSHRFK